ncbi:MAG: helix-turn-helix domain-containing protein [Lachnospiraceae bacterium]|nr:helix-turn-helix domain-containing protein [Lachnospiraceae bacterium]
MNTNQFNIGENIARLRHERKIRQEELADFVGVTKASVSKWENGQTMPDITILPQLASFFDIRIDELVGYEPQLSKEQIQKIYQELAAKFAKDPFREVMEESYGYVKRYYSCYPLLFQIGMLWLNHYMLTEDKEAQEKILEAAAGLSLRIENHCRDVALCSDAAAMRGVIYLMQGKAKEVVALLEDACNPLKLMSQMSTALTQAYVMNGDADMADSYTQCNMYCHVFMLVANAAQYLSIHAGELPVIEETVSRVWQVEAVYELTKLSPNAIAQFAYQAAVSYAVCGEKEKAVSCVGRYVDCIEELLSTPEIVLREDAYFNRMKEWFERLDSGPHAPRSRQLVIERLGQTLEHPTFALLEGDAEFLRLKRKLAFLAEK